MVDKTAYLSINYIHWVVIYKFLGQPDIVIMKICYLPCFLNYVFQTMPIMDDFFFLFWFFYKSTVKLTMQYVSNINTIRG